LLGTGEMMLALYRQNMPGRKSHHMGHACPPRMSSQNGVFFHSFWKPNCPGKFDYAEASAAKEVDNRGVATWFCRKTRYLQTCWYVLIIHLSTEKWLWMGVMYTIKSINDHHFPIQIALNRRVDPWIWKIPNEPSIALKGCRSATPRRCATSSLKLYNYVWV
jgi:hypothetical protein